MSDEIVTDTADETATVDAFLAEAGVELPHELTEAEGAETEEEKPKAKAKPEEKQDEKKQEEKKKEEIRAKRVAEHLKREAQFRKQTEQFKQEVQSKTQEFETHYQQLSSIKEQMEAMYEEAGRNPVGWLEKNFGITPEKYIDIVSRGGEVPQDYAISQLERKFQDRLAQLEGKLTQAEQARVDAIRQLEEEAKQRQEKQREQAMVQARAEAQKGFLAEVRANAEAYPDLQIYEDSHLISEVGQMVDMLTAKAKEHFENTGDDSILIKLQDLSYTDVAAALQEGVAGLHEKIRGGAPSRTTPSTQQSAPPVRAKTGPPVVTRRLPAKPELDRTLSNTMSASRGSAKNAFDDVDYDALKSELIRELERNHRD